MEWMNLFFQHILDRGMEYAEDGMVSELLHDNGVISAEVEGTNIYQVRIEFAKEEIVDMSCSCPYARKGYNCKHMAAVLCQYEGILSDLEDEDYYEEDESYIPIQNHLSESVLKKKEAEELLEKIPIDDLKKMMIQYILSDKELKNRLQLKYDFKMNAKLMAQLKREINDIVYRYSGRCGYIDWENASDYIHELNYFLDTKIPFLLEHQCYKQAFDLVNLVFWEVGNTDIDDSFGGTSMIAEKCYDFWKEIIEGCSVQEKEEFRKWFEQHKSDEYVFDYMEEYIQDFYDEKFFSDVEIKKEIKMLDEIIESHQGETDCGMIYSVRYGSQSTVLKRIECMKKLKMNIAEILEYRNCHRNFYVVRMLEIQEALDNQDNKQAIQILVESKTLDANNKNRVKEHSCKLIALYKSHEMMQEYYEELLYQVLNFYQVDLTYFSMLKKVAGGKKDWEEILDKILDSSENIYFTCDILNEEKRYEELMQLIEKNGDVMILDRYEKKLRKTYPGRVINMYKNYVILAMDKACDRKHYRYLVQYLKKIASCKNGKAEARTIADQWKNTYRRRSAMKDELQRAGF